MMKLNMNGKEFHTFIIISMSINMQQVYQPLVIL